MLKTFAIKYFYVETTKDMDRQESVFLQNISAESAEDALKFAEKPGPFLASLEVWYNGPFFVRKDAKIIALPEETVYTECSSDISAEVMVKYLNSLRWPSKKITVF